MAPDGRAQAVFVMCALACVARGDVDVALGAFCQPCKRPDQMYTGKNEYLNFEAYESRIPRATPDGEHPWPNAMASGWPNSVKCDAKQWPNPCFKYTSKDRAGWWDDYSEQKALPTHAWFTDVFSSSPIIVLPQVFHWPIFQVPYSIIAANDGLSVMLPRYQVATNGGVPGQAGSIKSDVIKGVPPEVQAGGTDREMILTCVDALTGDGVPIPGAYPLAERRIADYDPNTLHVELTYKTTGQGAIDFLLTKGSPFVTARYHAALPAFLLKISSVHDINGVDCTKGCSGVKGTTLEDGLLKYKLNLINGVNKTFVYLLYSSAELSLKVALDDLALARIITSTAPANPDAITLRAAVTESLFIPVTNATLPVQTDKRWSSLPGGKMKADEQVMDKAANTYPHVAAKGGSESVKFSRTDDAENLKVTVSWDTDCVVPGCSPGDLLMLALPHHQAFSASGPQTPVSNVQYPLVLGVGTGWKGATWVLSYPIVGTTSEVMGNAIKDHFSGSQDYTAGPDTNANPFFSANRIPEDKKPLITAALRSDMAYWTNVENADLQRSPQSMFMSSDLYSFAKFMAAVARLVVIADELGEARVARIGRDYLRCRLNQWFDPLQESSEYFPFTGSAFPNGGALRGGVWVYDTTWGGLPTGNGLKHPGPDWHINDTQPDFGSGGYNDHMFHNGYVMYSVAVVLMGEGEGGDAPGRAGLQFGEGTCRNMIKTDAEWFAPLQDRVLSIVRDIANPDQAADPYFPKFRHRADWYVSHTWARGLFPSGLGSSNLESTSEAVQAWYSMFLMGYAMKKGSDALAVAAGAAFGDAPATRRAANDDIADALMNAGSVLLVTELGSISWYFHPRVNSDDANRNDVFPQDFQSLGVNGNMWGFGTMYQAFFNYGSCQYDNPHTKDDCPHDLNIDQIHWFNRLFILQIQLLPYTPATEMLTEKDWLPGAFHTDRFTYTNKNGAKSKGYDPSAILDDLPSAYTTCNGTTAMTGRRCTQGWLAYAYQTLAAVDSAGKETAWTQALEMEGVADGGTLTNLLWWIASRDD
eukprot:TRINITY_DN29779_c0_g1_i1.p1 TRINITY_DN29779_c0_g1~~TRINITY_DN29779_c0_g1_i1.p1  ORF type:complete len:1041 (+),score=275.63 TRINITY_DN29779_c0_g1_i1:50-3172(+)